MQNEIKLFLKEAISKSLPILRGLCSHYIEPYQVWSKREDGAWLGKYEQRTSVLRVFRAGEKQIAEAALDFANLFFSEYPDYGGTNLVGFDGFGGQQLAHDKSNILKAALGHLWDRHGTFDCKESDVDAVVSEFEEFVEASTSRVRFQAQLLNFSMTESMVRLPENLTVRRLNEKEISELHGGPLRASRSSRHSMLNSIQEFVIEGEYLAMKVVATRHSNPAPARQTINALLDKAILCLRTFKAGFVGYQWVDFEFVKFCPIGLGSYGSGYNIVPPGVYRLSDEDLGVLPDFAKHIFTLSESALETACARLADAETRVRPQDQIFDAVVGMEALLLAGLGKEDRRSELKYRFSMNYSTLFGSPSARWDAYNLAKDFYNHRSAIAHGGSFKDEQLKVGKERLNLNETANRAKNMLREIIKRFLPDFKTAPYKKSQFWERKYFGIPDSNTES